MEPEPYRRFIRWLAQARRAKQPNAEAMALATAGADGRVSVRFVLLKDCDSRGFVFYTDARSKKGRELRQHPQASLAIYWISTLKQVRITGNIESVSDLEADAYWATRPRASRISASVSRQSAPLTSRRQLVEAVARLRRRLKGQPPPRPDYWRGYRLVPDEIEFWTQSPARLHRRELYRRAGKRWKRTLLQP
jgi:pyridoxamine 5'-phosphate oxidase